MCPGCKAAANLWREGDEMEDFQYGGTQLQLLTDIIFPLLATHTAGMFVQSRFQPFSKMRKQLLAQLLVEGVREKARKRSQVTDDSQGQIAVMQDISEIEIAR